VLHEINPQAIYRIISTLQLVTEEIVIRIKQPIISMCLDPGAN